MGAGSVGSREAGPLRVVGVERGRAIVPGIDLTKLRFGQKAFGQILTAVKFHLKIRYKNFLTVMDKIRGFDGTKEQ
jgi:hypothetical protein